MGSMIGSKEIDIREQAPQSGDVTGGTEGRINFSPTTKTFGVIAGEVEVMGTDFAGDGDTTGTSFGEDGDFMGSADMGNMNTTVGRTGSGDDVVECELSTEGRTVGVMIVATNAGEGTEALFIFGMDGDRNSRWSMAEMLKERLPVVDEQRAGG